jgi:hypothetical protein
VKRVLKLLQWRCPPNRWRLKNPTYSMFITALDKVFPDARYCMTHRDVANVIPSVADLYFEMHKPNTDRPDKLWMGSDQHRVLRTGHEPDDRVPRCGQRAPLLRAARSRPLLLRRPCPSAPDRRGRGLLLVLHRQDAVADGNPVHGQRHDAARAFARDDLEMIGLAADDDADGDIAIVFSSGRPARSRRDFQRAGHGEHFGLVPRALSAAFAPATSMSLRWS